MVQYIYFQHLDFSYVCSKVCTYTLSVLCIIIIIKKLVNESIKSAEPLLCLSNNNILVLYYTVIWIINMSCIGCVIYIYMYIFTVLKNEIMCGQSWVNSIQVIVHVTVFDFCEIRQVHTCSWREITYNHSKGINQQRYAYPTNFAVVIIFQLFIEWWNNVVQGDTIKNDRYIYVDPNV